MDLSEAVQLAALQAVLRHRERKSNDQEYALRRIFRWYSEKFHTPLHDVDTLPLTDVLQAYWECHYEDMKEQDIAEECERLLEDEESLRMRQLNEDADEVDLYEMGEEEKALQAATSVVKALENTVQQLKDSPLVPEGWGDEPELVNATAKQSAPAISMTFVDEDDIDLEADSFGLLADPKSK